MLLLWVQIRENVSAVTCVERSPNLSKMLWDKLEESCINNL